MPSSLGPAEILVILVVALIVLGPAKLPQAGRQVGRALAEMRRWTQDVKSEVTQAFDPTPEPPYAPVMDPDPTDPRRAEPLPAASSEPSPAPSPPPPTGREAAAADGGGGEEEPNGPARPDTSPGE